MFKKMLLIFILLLITNIAKADVFSFPVKTNIIVKELPEIKNTTCTFTQEKTIAGTNNILKSGGNFYFKKDSGVTFETLYPITSTVIYDKNSNKNITKIVNAITNNDYSFIEKNFVTYFSKVNQTWNLGLIPNNNTKFSEGLDKIIISGSNYIKKIEIYTKNKDNTTLNFNCNFIGE